MIRSSQHILKFSNQFKLQYIEQLYTDYEKDLKFYINLILSNKLPFKSLLSSKSLPTNIIAHSQWKQIIYKNASEIIRSNIKAIKNKRYQSYKKIYTYFKKHNRQLKFLNKRFSELNLKSVLSLIKIEVKNISINIDQRLLSYNNNSKYFNEFIGLKLPYFYNNKHRAIQINLPIKYHKQSLKYKNWNRRNTVQLKKINNNFYIKFFYEKEFIPKENGYSIGFDIGYNKLLTDSNGNYYGKELKGLYQRISNKKQGSKNFKQLLTHRTNETNRIINSINLNDINQIYIEELKNLYYKTKLSTKLMNKLQRLTYSKVMNKFEILCEEQGINLEKVSPKYTSQTCSKCGSIHKENRKNEIFECIDCRMKMDADYNAAINILHRGVYNPSTLKSVN